MAAVINDVGKRRFLDFLTGFGGTGLSGVLYHLYTNNVAPAHGDPLAAYTEAAWTGYLAQTVGLWGGSVLTPQFRASAIAPALVFSNGSGAPVSVFGYFVTDPGGTLLLFAERFAGAPLSIPAAGTLTVVPNVTDTSEF